MSSEYLIYGPRRTLFLLSLLFLTAATAGFAADQAVEDQKPQDDAVRVVEEITVTATKRETKARETSISIEVIEGETLAALGIQEMSDLSSVVPGFHSGFGLLTQGITLRGIGSGADRSFEQAVAFFADGIYLPRSRQLGRSFLDVQRVEVLRGPQAVLHGLNATAGAVSMVSRRSRPGDAFTLDLTTGYEFEHGGRTLTAVLGGSPHEKLGLRAALRLADADGFDVNSTLNREEGDRDEFFGRLSAWWTPTEDLVLWAKVEHDVHEVFGHAGEVYALSAPLLEPGDGVLNRRRSADGSLFDRFGVLGESPGQEIESTNVTLHLDANLGEGTLSLIGGFSEFDYRLATDVDGTALSLLDGSLYETNQQESLELRYSGSTEAFSYVLGAYHHHSDLLETQSNVYGEDALGPGLALIPESIYRLDTKIDSFFAHGSWGLSDTLRLLGGVRYSIENKEARRRSFCRLALLPDTFLPVPPALAGALCPSADLDGIVADRSSGNLMPELVLEWNPSDDVMLYAKGGRSAKGGGFAAATFARAEEFEYDDETATGYEIGVKSRLAGGRAQLNIALFSTRLSDLQVTSVLIEDQNGIPIVRPAIRNAARAESRGLEIEGRLVLGRSLLFGGSLSLLDATFSSFPEAPCNTVETDPSGVCDLSGRDLPFAASWSADLYFDWERSIRDGAVLRAGLNLALSDKYFTEGALDPNAVQEGWTRISARLGWTSSDRRWSVALIGRNLTDEKVLESSQGFGGTHFLGYLTPPRTIQLQTSFRLHRGGTRVR